MRTTKEVNDYYVSEYGKTKAQFIADKKKLDRAFAKAEKENKVWLKNHPEEQLAFLGKQDL